jgi:hypothetical protein
MESTDVKFENIRAWYYPCLRLSSKKVVPIALPGNSSLLFLQSSVRALLDHMHLRTGDAA